MSTNPFIFLGIAERASIHATGVDLLSVSPMLQLPFFPQILNGVYGLLGVHKDYWLSFFEKEFQMVLKDAENEEISAWRTWHFNSHEVDNPANINPEVSNCVYVDKPNLDTSPTYYLFPASLPPLTVIKPSIIRVEVSVENQSWHIGSFSCSFVETPAISSEEKDALRSRTNSRRSILLGVGCKQCNTAMKLYLPLDENNSEKPLDAIYLSEAKDSWMCSCQKTSVPLHYAKRGLHFALRHSTGNFKDGKLFQSVRPMYEKGQLLRIHSEFLKIISSTPKEEEVQKFMESHLVLWSFLSPVKVWKKPSILTKKKADFGFLTPQRILYLVEIEKPQTRVSRKGGGMHSDVNKAFDQIRDWSFVVANHRTALLDELGLKFQEIDDVRYIVVAGLRHQEDPEELMKMQQNVPTEKTQFFCFDEIAASLHVLQSQLSEV